jgi:hypothetical protein
LPKTERGAVAVAQIRAPHGGQPAVAGNRDPNAGVRAGVSKNDSGRAPGAIALDNADGAGQVRSFLRIGEHRFIRARIQGQPQREFEPADRAPVLEEIDGVPQEEAPFGFVPGGIERYLEPSRQPVERLGRRAAHVKQHVNRRDPILDCRVEPLDVGEEPVEERRRFGVVAVHRGQVVLQIREARIVDAQCREARGQAAVPAES